MNHDEKTTEIEIPPKSNVTQFRRRATDKQAEISSQPTLSKPGTGSRAHFANRRTAIESFPATALPRWLQSVDLTNPWLIRLAAVLIIIGLSLLVI